MDKVVLIVDGDAPRRAALTQVLATAGKPFALAPDIFQGIAALGRADFGALIASEGRLQSLRGLCRLARKRHASIHLFVMLKPGTTPEQVRQAVGLTVECLPPDVKPDQVGMRVLKAMAGPAPIDFDALSTAMVQMDVQMALDLESALPPSDDGDVFSDAPAAPQPESPPDEPSLLEGSLDDGSGSALLMGLFAQEVTGRLDVDAGPARGVLYFVNGEPGWAVLPGGDAALFKRLVEGRLLHPNLPRPAVPEGMLMGELIRTRHLEGPAVQKFTHDLIRERLTLLTTQRTGSWRFSEERDFMQRHPLVKVNSFGVILETCRKALTPDRLLVVGSEMERQYLIPGPALASASPKLASFARGADVGAIVDGRTTAGEFYQRTGLDVLMGALVVMVLLESRLVSLADMPVTAGQVPLAKAVVLA
ncbi:MAG: DUF4388 domain-containing protein [Myxococcota bacterium]